MTCDLDIYRAAHDLIKQHRENAPVHATIQTNRLAEASDMEGRAVWMRIVKPTRELLDDPLRNDGEEVY